MMNNEDILKTIQKYLENNPLIVLGSVASLPYGLPSMDGLKKEIESRKAEFVDDKSSTLWDNIVSMNLEEAVDKSNLSDGGKNKLRAVVWECINRTDLEFFKKLTGEMSFPLAELFKQVIKPTPNHVNVVTTNYDRLAEYAADIIGATAITGFEGRFIQKSEFPDASIQKRRISARERVVSIWKVHGSLDWFINSNQSPVSYPQTRDIPENHIPLIIPPGKDKNSATHAEPFRDLIAQADVAFKNAGSFLCIGYGFNDDHIQPKLLGQIRDGKPIVVLAKQATASCYNNVMQANISKRIIIEEADNEKTKVNINSEDNEIDGDLWNLKTFIQQIWGE